MITINPNANVIWQTNVDGLTPSFKNRKVNRLGYEDATYGYIFFSEVPVDDIRQLGYYGYTVLRDEMIDDISRIDEITQPELIFPFDGCEDELPSEACECGGCTSGSYQY